MRYCVRTSRTTVRRTPRAMPDRLPNGHVLGCACPTCALARARWVHRPDLNEAQLRSKLAQQAMQMMQQHPFLSSMKINTQVTNSSTFATTPAPPRPTPLDGKPNSQGQYTIPYEPGPERVEQMNMFTGRQNDYVPRAHMIPPYHPPKPSWWQRLLAMLPKVRWS